MKITSPAFADKIPVPAQYTCNGTNQSPPLEFLDVPKDTKSLVVILRDVDSTDGKIHWLVYNIPSEVTHFDEGVTPPDSVEGICSNGSTGYKGPCPKNFKGIHKFSFTLFAVDTTLDIPGIADADKVIFQMENHVLATAELLGIVEGEKASDAI